MYHWYSFILFRMSCIFNKFLKAAAAVRHLIGVQVDSPVTLAGTAAKSNYINIPATAGFIFCHNKIGFQFSFFYFMRYYLPAIIAQITKFRSIFRGICSYTGCCCNCSPMCITIRRINHFLFRRRILMRPACSNRHKHNQRQQNAS